MIPGWQKTTLGEACRIEKGKASAANEPPGMYPLITTGDGRKSAAEWQFEGPAVCVPMISAFGHGKPGLKRVHYQEGKFALANILAALLVRNPEELSAKFLAAFLNFYKDQLIVPLQFGAANMSVTVERLATVPIWFPTRPEQEKILALIDEAESLRATRLRANSRLEQFVPALFHEMFRDPAKNEKNWKQQPLGELCEVRTGKLNSNAAIEDGKYPFFTCSREIFSIDTFAFDCEAVLLSGNNASGDFDVKLYKGKFNAYQRTYVITVKEQYLDSLDYLILKTTLENNLESLKNQSIGGLTKYLTLGMITSIHIPLPPLSLQREFAERVREARAIQSAQGRSAERVEALYQSMLSRAFAGEL